MKELEHYLAEARRQDLVYQEKKVKDKLDKVTVALSGNESGQFTKLIKEYVEIEKQIETLGAKRGELNAEMKEKAEDLFDAEEIYVTRIIETASATIQLSKAAVAKRGDDKVDYEKAFKALMELVPELKERGDELIKEFTVPGELGKPKSSALTIKDVKEDVQLDEAAVKDLFKIFTDKFKALKKSFTSWARGYDSKLKRIKAQAKLA
jgi:hypothetical protein